MDHVLCFIIAWPIALAIRKIVAYASDALEWHSKQFIESAEKKRRRKDV